MIIRDEKGNELLDILKVDELQAEKLYTPITHTLVIIRMKLL